MNRKPIAPVNHAQIENWTNPLLISFLVGEIITILFKNSLTPLVFSGRSFSGRSLVFQVVVFLSLWLLDSAIVFAIIIALQKILHKSFQLDPIVKLSTNHRIITIILIIGFGIAMIYFFNNVFPLIDTNTWKLNIYTPFPPGYPAGIDFRVGIYWPAEMILNNQNIYIDANSNLPIYTYSNYPPFVNVFFMPLQLLSENAAYVLFIFAILISNIISLGLTSIIIKDIFFSRLGIERQYNMMLSLFLFFTMLFYTLTSYSFLFSIERGNYDSIAFMFAVLSLYLMIKKPESLWLQVILLSIATHLKIYPAALFLALFVKHGKKMLLPSLAINTLFLLSLGFKNAYLFIGVIIHYTLTPVNIWIGNHSGFSFAELLYGAYPTLDTYISSLRLIFTIIPILIWALSSLLIIKYHKNEMRSVYLLMVAVPLMCLIPTISHDYKLIILSVSFLILLSILIIKIYRDSKFWDYFQLLLVIILALMIGRSYNVVPDASLFFNNKYPTILLLALLMTFNVMPIRGLTTETPPIQDTLPLISPNVPEGLLGY